MVMKNNLEECKVNLQRDTHSSDSQKHELKDFMKHFQVFCEFQDFGPANSPHYENI